ncbi:hypothetical protein [Aquimarina sp. 2201CG5-10]|uniref:hypothetical protein n=1 Tax=Aquimarina callyspongiae TaxID=3098150 RepID=UPI002AB3EF53|nr:hypothetical protein [Aquimarina sp. 2201CG5-10]MDY8135852.1 hypothetical protein [Aquimarina sp. 2201CG5-10]
MKPVKVILYIVVVFIFQEMVFRYFFPTREIQNFDRINFMKLYFDGAGSSHSRDQTWEWRSFPDTSASFEHKMNLYGFRDNEWYIEKPKNKKRVLFIGDSFVEGVMAQQDETIPRAFEKASNNTYQSLNGGLLGCGLDSYLQLAADMIPVYQPDVAFLCIYANDLGKKPPKIPEFFLEPEYFNPYVPRLVEIINQSKKYGPLRFRWIKNKQPYLPAVPNETNPWSRLEDSLKYDVTPELADHMKASTFNSFLGNALFKEEKFLKSSPALGETVGFFKYICNQYNVKPVVVYIPSRNQVTDYYLQFEKQYCLNECADIRSLTTPDYQQHQQFLKNQCDYLQVPFIDLTTTVKTEEIKGEHLYWNYDQHMRAKGYRLVGETIWNQWRDK